MFVLILEKVPEEKMSEYFLQHSDKNHCSRYWSEDPYNAKKVKDYGKGVS
jgi:hypothetical protein